MSKAIRDNITIAYPLLLKRSYDSCISTTADKGPDKIIVTGTQIYYYLLK